MKTIQGMSIAAAAALAAWGGMANAQTLRVVEVLTTNERTGLMEQIASEFEAAHEGVDVELVSVPWDSAFEQILTMTMSGQQIDVLEMPERWISTLAVNDLLTDLGPWLDEWQGADQMTEATMDFARIYDDTAYFLPYGYFVRAMYYNRDLLSQAGYDAPPETWEEFAEISRAVSEIEGKYGYCLRGSTGGFVGWWLAVSGMTGAESWFNEDGTSVFASPEAIEGIQMMLDLYEDGAAPRDSVNWGFNEQVSGFYSGTCAFMDQDPDALIQVRERLGDDEFATAPVPLGPPGKISPPIGMFGWSVPASSENPDLAKDFIGRLMEPEANLEWAKFIGIVPAVEIPEDDEYFNDPVYAGFFEELDSDQYNLVPWPAYLPELGEFFDVIAVETSQAALLGQMSAEELGQTWDEFLTEAQQRWMAENQ
ncbi:sugar ABC transporter substrate-binding protein [Palleronia sp. LCG004]|uniref:ABC transporter substrate-binding protein n=1 Tax=Palleronia sp. LCG004 TaxID=3079304 RepID=UPI0029438276|nr:sugar ABC transporter substrate-binding protein [Palleronia sp. LCG004]WOI57728.1 sugar ABC transporter substrate-binding protein [Palleronia sp. LCG004]